MIDKGRIKELAAKARLLDSELDGLRDALRKLSEDLYDLGYDLNEIVDDEEEKDR